MPKHRAPRYARTKKVIARAPVAAGATAVGLGMLSTPANAATTHDWTGVAQCESGGNWHINTGNGYFGGLQFSPSTWAGYGGAGLAPRADLATPAQQVQIAEKVLAGQGIGAWPVCGKRLATGTTPASASTAATPAPASTAHAAPAPATQSSAAPADAQQDAAGYGRHAASAGEYAVVRGDTVAKIAAAHAEPWRALYQRNAGVIGADPNLIFPGQVLAVSGATQAAPAPATTTATAHSAQTAAPAPAAPAPAAAAAATPNTAVTTNPAVTTKAHITDSAGPVKPQTQAAADAVVSNVPGAATITLGGTRASAVDPHGHPSGLALDYMVLSNTGLGNAIVQYHIAHWHELGVEYLIYQQKVLTSPTGAWKQMEDRGSATANHMDHVHVNYVG